MKVWQLLVPKLVVKQPIWLLDVNSLQQKGIKGMVLDVDNTLLGNREVEVSPAVRHWVKQVRQQMPLWLVSNNCWHKRIKTIADSLELPFYASAAKPSRRCVKKAIVAMGLEPAQVAMVGDRLLTDILVGNRLGMYTILIQPPAPVEGTSRLVREGEFWLARLFNANYPSCY
ncbi:MAG: YqeG family HAD IIIA-type phosphatase [Pseudanabaenaceae cyanobacterium SKYGB_i_bin29]|nr:YqeG family HAD IIIA-type phosphatase [Pseudanabaenaceae cyanobacterium SKYG29]MDW8421267.1 YqeG family HAD IIIA-type phosphatase [Pseudanabaenaceae cyanobacterium SKYGB_i_bin29]